jgi:hypothetical protein
MLQALLFTMQSLTEQELEEISELIKHDPSVAAQFPGGGVDQCQLYCEIMEEFMLWGFLARKNQHTETSILQVGVDGLSLRKQLKEVFPEHSGLAIRWKFPKFHALRHIPRLLVFFGSLENISTQVSFPNHLKMQIVI